MSQWVLHHDPRFWERPDEFDPDRWDGGPSPSSGQALGQSLPRFAYFPFGGGARQCIGSGFAMLEATLLLATIAQRYRLALVPDQPIEPWPSVTLRPKHGVRVIVHAR